MRDRVGDELVDCFCSDDAGGHERGDPLDRGEQDQADALGITSLEDAVCLALLDQLEYDREGAVSGLVQYLGLLPMFAREHQLEQRGVARGELDVCARGCPQARLEVLAGTLHRALQLGAEASKPRLRECVEQRLPVGEVPAWRSVADADLARQLAQRQVPGTVLAYGALGLLEQSRAKVAVVIRPLSHRPRKSFHVSAPGFLVPARLSTSSRDVVIDSIVFIVYIVAYDYIQYRRYP